MTWKAVAVDHWVATIDGHPVSIKYWPMGWVLVRKASYNGRRGQLHKSLKSAVWSAVHNPKG